MPCSVNIRRKNKNNSTPDITFYHHLTCIFGASLRRISGKAHVARLWSEISCLLFNESSFLYSLFATFEMYSVSKTASYHWIVQSLQIISLSISHPSLCIEKSLCIPQTTVGATGQSNILVLVSNIAEATSNIHRLRTCHCRYVTRAWSLSLPAWSRTASIEEPCSSPSILWGR